GGLRGHRVHHRHAERERIARREAAVDARERGADAADEPDVLRAHGMPPALGSRGQSVLSCGAREQLAELHSSRRASGPTMERARDQTQQHRLRRMSYAGLAVVAVLVAGVAVLFQSFLAGEQAAIEELADAARMHRLLDDTLQLTVDAETAQRGYVLTGDPL